jgi:hypothetical protein
MRFSKSKWLKGLLAPVLALGFAGGCTTYNPATGQTEVDYGATAGVAGAAMGAAALGVALSNNDDDRYYYGGHGYHGGGRYHGGNYHQNTNVNVNRNVNVNQNYKKVNKSNKANRANVQGRGRLHR